MYVIQPLHERFLMDRCIYYPSRVCKWIGCYVVWSLCGVYPIEIDYSVHIYGVYLVHQ